MGSSGLVPFKGLGPGQFIPTTKSIRHLLQKGSAVVVFCAEFVGLHVSAAGVLQKDLVYFADIRDHRLIDRYLLFQLQIASNDIIVHFTANWIVKYKI